MCARAAACLASHTPPLSLLQQARVSSKKGPCKRGRGCCRHLSSSAPTGHMQTAREVVRGLQMMQELSRGHPATSPPPPSRLRLTLRHTPSRRHSSRRPPAARAPLHNARPAETQAHGAPFCTATATQRISTAAVTRSMGRGAPFKGGARGGAIGPERRAIVTANTGTSHPCGTAAAQPQFLPPSSGGFAPPGGPQTWCPSAGVASARNIDGELRGTRAWMRQVTRQFLT